MTWRSTALNLVLLALLAFLVSARADTLTLRDGTTVTGSWVGAEAGQIRFMVNNRVRTYPRSDVSEVIFGPDQSAPPPKASPEPDRKPAAKSHGVQPVLKLEMTFDQVEAALGKPAQLFDNLPGGKTIYVYKVPPVKITFRDGKVADVE